MAAAYIYAENGSHIPEDTDPQLMILLADVSRKIARINAIDRFGVQGATGKLILGAKEIRLMAIAENVVEAYKDRERANDLGEWQQMNQDRSDLLVMAMNKAFELGYIKHA